MRIKLDWQGKAIVPLSLVYAKGLIPGAVKLFIILIKLREEDRDISYKEIADSLGYSPTTIKKWLDSLIKTGWAKKSEDYFYLRMHTPLKRKELP